MSSHFRETSTGAIPAPAAGQPWRIRPVLPVAKGLGAVAVVVLVLAFNREDPIQWAIATAAAVGLALWALRDVLAPVRLAADRDGIMVVSGYARRERLAWSDIENVRLDHRDRLGISSLLLEIDTDDALHLFSMHDLGADPREVLESLQRLRAGDDQDIGDTAADGHDTGDTAADGHHTCDTAGQGHDIADTAGDGHDTGDTAR
jgi:hypothetical protein